jgi:hypothetical protein
MLHFAHSPNALIVIAHSPNKLNELKCPEKKLYFQQGLANIKGQFHEKN